MSRLPRADAGEAALADATLLRVLARIASPLRHDLAGALLVPQMQLQMLRRKLRKADLDCGAAAAAIDEVLLRIDEVRAMQLAALNWLTRQDERRLLPAEVVAKATADFALAFAARGSEVHCSAPGSGASCAAQPLLLLVHAGFCAVLDDAASASARVEVRCTGTGSAIQVDWLRSAGTGIAREAAGAAAHGAVSTAGVAALCARHGARFAATASGWRLECAPDCWKTAK